jgi:hypothetical protein
VVLYRRISVQIVQGNSDPGLSWAQCKVGSIYVDGCCIRVSVYVYIVCIYTHTCTEKLNVFRAVSRCHICISIFTWLI